MSQLPALALPPIHGLLLLLGAYILLIGPVNYIVLRRLDRREWAWVTMPLLIVVFAVGAYGFGAALRGSNVIINEVAIVRGAPGATDGAAQVYLGVFSPSRETYQLEVLAVARCCRRRSAASSSAASRPRAASTSCRAIPRGSATSRSGSRRCGRSARRRRRRCRSWRPSSSSSTVRKAPRNASEEKLEKPAIVIGGSVQVLKDLLPESGWT